MKKLLCLILVMGLLVPAGWAAEAADEDDIAEEKLTRAAIFEIRAIDEELKVTAKKVAPLLQAALGTNPDLELVEREALRSIMTEQGLSVTGLVDEDEAVKVAQLAGADVLITGRIFELDEELIFSAKIIGVETSRVYAKVVKGKLTDPLAPLVDEMSKKLGKIIIAKKSKFFAKKKVENDPLPSIMKAIEDKKLPRVAVEVFEKHINREAIDPTVEIELMGLLTEAGFTVYDPKSRLLSDWAEEYLEKGKVPRSMENVDVVIVGEAFTEDGVRTHGNLWSTKGRIEIKAIDNKTGVVLAVGRGTRRALDMSPMISAKTSLEKGTKKMAPKFISRMVREWNKKLDKEARAAAKKEKKSKKDK